MNQIKIYSSRIKTLAEQIGYNQKINLTPILKWLKKKRESNHAQVKFVNIFSLKDWKIDKKGIKHKKGLNHFFSVQGIEVKNATKTEVDNWNQPILVQKMGGIMAILCQKKDRQIKFLLHAKFEPGNIGKIQLAPTMQATFSNLKRHHGGKKPIFSEYLNHPMATIIYSAQHNEEGSRFFEKSNINKLILLDEKVQIPLDKNGDYIWLTLPEIKGLFLYNNIVNPFVKTILSAI